MSGITPEIAATGQGATRIVDGKVVSVTRGGVTELAGAHPEGPPAATDEAEMLRLVLERFTGDDIYPAFLRDVAKEALQRSPSLRGPAPSEAAWPLTVEGLRRVYEDWLLSLVMVPPPTAAGASKSFARFAIRHPVLRGRAPGGEPPEPGENAEGLSIICRKCGYLQSGVEAGNRVRWVTCAACHAPAELLGEPPAEDAARHAELYRDIRAAIVGVEVDAATSRATADRIIARVSRALQRVPPARP